MKWLYETNNDKMGKFNNLILKNNIYFKKHK
jgi:hypothetical protein